MPDTIEEQVAERCPPGEHDYWRDERGEFCESCGVDWSALRHCNAPVRGFPEERCGLDPGHRGHHSCVATACDGCGRMRRASQITVTDEFVGQLCWWCANRPDRRDDYLRSTSA